MQHDILINNNKRATNAGFRSQPRIKSSTELEPYV